MRDTRLLRALVAGATGAVLAATLATPAGASTTDARPTPDLSGPHQRVAADASAPLAEVGALAEVPAASCPRGTRLRTTLVAESFETGLPDPQYTVGWDRLSATEPVAGTWTARSTWAGPSPTPNDPAFHEMYLGEHVLAPGTTTYLSFASRGSDVFDNVYFGAFGALWGDDLTAEWTRIQVPITEGIDADGYLYPVIAHGQGSAASWWEVDDVKVITCGPLTPTGIRGDWTADRKVDLLATTPGGELAVFPGVGDGTLARGFAVGTGWASMTYLGSPGDINGDKFTDLIARSADGTLYMYAGVGDGVFKKAAPIGQKWNGMTALITTGDVEGNGRPDLMARRNDGTLHLYQFSTTGTLSYTRQLGKGWSSMVWLVGVGDLDGDKRGDVLAVNRAGEMYSYKGTAAGLVGLGKVGTGWEGATWVTSGGDLNGDGRGDVMSRDADGDLQFHAGQGIGVGAGVYVSSGWDEFARIL